MLTNNVDCSRHSELFPSKELQMPGDLAEGDISEPEGVGGIGKHGVQHTSVGNEESLGWDFECSDLGIRPGFGETLLGTRRTVACTASLD